MEEDILCEICLEKPSIMTIDYSNGGGSDDVGTAWKSVCISCFNKRFEKQQKQQGSAI